MQSNLEQIKLGLEIILQEAIQINRELKRCDITNSISSIKESIRELDKSILKTVRRGEFSE